MLTQKDLESLYVLCKDARMMALKDENWQYYNDLNQKINNMIKEIENICSNKYRSIDKLDD